METREEKYRTRKNDKVFPHSITFGKKTTTNNNNKRQRATKAADVVSSGSDFVRVVLII